MPDIPGDLTTDAAIRPNQTVSSALETTGDHDWWKVSLQGGLTYGFRFITDGSASALPDPDLALRNFTGTVQRQVINDTFNPTIFSYTASGSGPIFLDIFDSGGDTGIYNLEFIATDVIRGDRWTDQLVSDAPLTTFNGRIEVAGDTDWFRANVKAGYDYQWRVDADPATGFVPQVQLVDINGNVVQEAQTDAATGAQYLTYSATAPTALFVKVGNANGAGDYSVTQVSYDEVPDVPHSETDYAYSSRIDSPQDSDWLQENLSAGLTSKFTITPAWDGFTAIKVTLRDAAGNAVGETLVNSPDSPTVTYIYTPTEAGRYYLDVEGNGSVGQTGRYMYSHWDDYIRGDIYTTKTLVDGATVDPKYFSSRIEMAGDSDWFKFQATEGITYTFNAISSYETGAMVMNIRDASGAIIASDSGNSASDSLATLKLQAGATETWFIDIQMAGDGTGGYRLNAISTAPELRATWDYPDLRGGGLDTTIYGHSRNNVLDGGGGNDTLYGGAGYDTLFGNIGNDYLDGGQGGSGPAYMMDELYGGDGNDTLKGRDGRDVLDGGNGDDQLFAGLENDRLAGGAGNDRLDGGDGRDIIFGGSGNDMLLGGAGRDTLIGGSGADLFVFAANGGVDRIDDFENGFDRIRIDDGARSYDQLSIEQYNDYVVIQSSNFVIYIDDTQRSQIDASDFLFA
ncbi:calcium-binding protein [Paracoccus pacificus]|uniref:Calcium-binding protein n=1 Tax=Paracoccus pacificus TaxID=1463598 RepID=A0ABW4R6Z4_9RHOB